MKCRACQAEIADKAIVCYRCGTPTADLPSVPRKAPAATRPARWLIAFVFVVIVGLTTYGTSLTPPDAPSRYAVWAAAVVAIVLTLWMARRR